MENDNTNATPNPLPNTSKKKKAFNKQKFLIVGLIVVIVVLVALLIIPNISKLKNQGMNYNVVCDDAVVQRYNNALLSLTGDMEKITSLAEEIKGKSGYEKDPTCLQITYMNSVIKQDIDSARQELGLTKEMNERGERPDMHLQQINPIPIMEGFVNQSSGVTIPDTENTEEINGRG